MKSSDKARGKKSFEFLCDAQNIIISVLRYSMKDIPSGEIVRYALERIIRAPFLPFSAGCVQASGGETGGLSTSAEVDMTKRLRAISLPPPATAGLRGSGVTVEYAGAGPALCRALVVRGGSILGVMSLFFKPGRCSLSPEEEGFVCAAASVIAGIIAREAAEEEAAAIRKELQAARRLADIGALAASVAHELRSPLAVIKMAASNIGRKYRGKECEQHLANIDKKIYECDRIIKNLLFYARLREPVFEKVNLYDIILETLREISPAAGPGVRVRRSLGPVKNVYVKADPVQMKEVFSNLLLNALESMEGGGGSVTVSARLGEDGRPSVSFRDSGPGIDKDALGKIFSPFWTTKARGNGLGLTVAESIMRMHGGGIRVESDPGEGSVFSLVLPAVEEQGGG